MALTESQIRRRQAVAGVLVALACWALISAAQLLRLFEPVDLTLLDWRYRVRGERPASASIALVVIDDTTIHAYGGWPIPRDQYALLLTAVEQAGARATGVDLQFPADRNQDPRSDALLAYVASQQERLVLALWFHADAGSMRHEAPLEPEVRAALERQGVEADDAVVAVAAGVGAPYADLAVSARQLGHLTVAVDRDGVVRRQPAVVRYGDRVYASLALRMAGAAQGRTAPPHAHTERGALRVGWDGGPAWTLPLDDEGATSVDFSGDRASFPRSYSMLDVLHWYRAGDSARLRDAFGGRLVLVGLDSRKEVTADVGATPFSAVSPFLLMHANALDNLLRNRFLVRPPAGAYLAVLGLLAALLGLAFGTGSLHVDTIVAGAAVLVIAAADLALFVLWSVDAPPTSAILLAPACYAGVTRFRYAFLERRTRQREREIHEGRSVQQQFLPEALVGQRLSHYDILERLGAGGMGVVYRGRDRRLGRDVAIKVLTGRALADDRARRRFRAEAHALSRLAHPHIAGIYDFDSQDGTDFIVMELAPGEPLSTRIRRGPLSEAEAAAIALEIAEALMEAHGHGIVHRDLKPGNVILSGRGDVKILDFGLARVVDRAIADSATPTQSITEEGHAVGTLPYMSPEVLRGERAGPSTDLYSLGVILFEMLTGRRPFPEGEPYELMHAALNLAPPSVRSLNPRISAAMESLVARALQKSPGSRFASAEEFRQGLEPLARRGMPPIAPVAHDARPE